MYLNHKTKLLGSVLVSFTVLWIAPYVTSWVLGVHFLQIYSSAVELSGAAVTAALREAVKPPGMRGFVDHLRF